MGSTDLPRGPLLHEKPILMNNIEIPTWTVNQNGKGTYRPELPLGPLLHEKPILMNNIEIPTWTVNQNGKGTYRPELP
jgi:hypothetical protein